MEQNYLPLFRKYRPQSFKDVVGQESLVKALTNAIELNRIANAYLFCGPRGTGKTSSARIFAKSLNCVNGPTLEPCQKCPSCTDITNASGLDVIEIDAASNRGIQDAKDLIAQVQYAPINGKYKIFIIDEVHMLSNDAFNALLKTFEEPPKNVIFILATTEPHKVLETIVSRCQRFDLRRITVDDIIKRLREIADIEGIKITDDALFTIAKNVSGGLRDSLALLDQVSVIGIKEEIGKDLIEELLGKINFDVLLNLLKNIYNEDIAQTLALIDEIYTKGNEPRNLAENLIEFLRNVILVLNSENTESITKFTTLISDDIQKVKNSNFDKDKVLKILNIIIDFYKEIKSSTNPYLWMEVASISACKLELKAQNVVVQSVGQAVAQTTLVTSAIQSAKTMAFQAQAPIKQNVQPEVKPEIKQETVAEKQIEKPVERIVEQQPVQQAQQTPVQQPVAQEPVQQQTVEQVSQPQVVPQEIAQNQDSVQIWANVLAAIPSLPTRAFYSGVGKLVGIKNNVIKIGFLYDNTLAQAKSPAKFSALENAIKSTYPSHSAEFIKIDASTRVLEVRPKMASRPQVQPQPMANPMSAPSLQPQQAQIDNQGQVQSTQNSSQAQDENKQTAEKRQYSYEVNEMIQQFNGKIID